MNVGARKGHGIGRVESTEPAARQTVTRESFTDAMAATATGVTVVTAASPEGGEPLGQTVSAMCSVSADPPTLLVCINQRSPLVAAITYAGRFAVNVLASHHVDVADTFAGRPRAGIPWDFRCADWESGALGAPLLCDAAAVFECHLHLRREVGTHIVFVGSVVHAGRRHQCPLVYADRRYRRLAVANPRPITHERETA